MFGFLVCFAVLESLQYDGVDLGVRLVECEAFGLGVNILGKDEAYGGCKVDNDLAGAGI